MWLMLLWTRAFKRVQYNKLINFKNDKNISVDKELLMVHWCNHYKVYEKREVLFAKTTELPFFHVRLSKFHSHPVIIITVCLWIFNLCLYSVIWLQLTCNVSIQIFDNHWLLQFFAKLKALLFIQWIHSFTLKSLQFPIMKNFQHTCTCSFRVTGATVFIICAKGEQQGNPQQQVLYLAWRLFLLAWEALVHCHNFSPLTSLYRWLKYVKMSSLLLILIFNALFLYWTC